MSFLIGSHMNLQNSPQLRTPSILANEDQFSLNKMQTPLEDTTSMFNIGLFNFLKNAHLLDIPNGVSPSQWPRKMINEKAISITIGALQQQLVCFPKIKSDGKYSFATLPTSSSQTQKLPTREEHVQNDWRAGSLSKLSKQAFLSQHNAENSAQITLISLCTVTGRLECDGKWMQKP